METFKRQVTIIDELWDNEQSNSNRRLYDEQERALQRKNIELNDRVKKFEKQLEVIKQDQPKDHTKELIKRSLSKQASEFNKLLAKKDEEIQHLNAQVKQISKPTSLESALRQANIEKLHLEKRLLSSNSSLNSTTTTNASPTTTLSTSTTDDPTLFPRTSSSSTTSVDPTYHQSSQKANETLKTDTHHLTYTNDDNATKLNVQRQKLNDLQESYKHLELKYKQLLDIEERYKKEKLSYESTLQENEKLKEKIHSLENDQLTKKSPQNNHQDLEKELQLSIKERETVSTLNTQLHTDVTNLTNTNERLTDECKNLRKALAAKSDEYEQLKIKNVELESTIKSLRDTSDIERRLNDENEINKKELKRKQDDLEQFQRMHDTTKRENQATIHQLQDKIHDLERKTELQSLKHEEILLQFETLKTRRDRTLPTSSGNILSILNNPNILPKMIHSQMSNPDDSAPIKSRQRSTNSNDKSAHIVIAKYSYDPLKDSPNDHPEIELPLKSGEYYLIYGDIDEDGFYDGRNLDGRYGLIPSNFIELITNPYDLPEHTKHVIQKLTGKNIPVDERITRHREQTPSLDSDVFTNNSPPSIPTVRKQINSSASDMSADDLSYGKHVPHPTNLRIEKSLSNSVMIAWNPPSTNTQILGYQVLLDHSLYTTIRANERTRALLENINLNEKSHRISIRTITQHGLSRDQECTLLLTNSKDSSYVPTDLRVDRITQTSAVVSWWPASNDISHKLYVNDMEVQTLKPGIYRFKLSGLSPNTMHKVMIKAKPAVPLTPQQQVATSVEFRTTSFEKILINSGSSKIHNKQSKYESIEPPKRVQVIAGPQTNTILVSWEQSPSINIARGYRILIDGRQVQDITNPLNDHTVINLNTLHPGRYLTIRTLTDNSGESHDSTSIDLDDVLKKLDMDISLVRIASISKEIVVSFQTITDNEIIKSPLLSPTIKNHRKTSRRLSSITQDLPTPNSPSPVSKPIITGKDMNKSLTRSPLESPSMTSSINTDTIPTIQSPQVDSNRIRSPINENLNIKKSITPEEQHSSPIKTTPQKSKNPFINKLIGPPRIFVALFDYDPHAMSPNQDSEEELPFKKGEIIKIYGDQDGDGFYIGQTDKGRTGYVPSNMVSEIESDDSETESSVSSAVSPIKRTPPAPLPLPSPPKSTKKKMFAQFDYNPSENSPNANHKDELSFRKGDIIYVHGNIRDDGFYSGELENGKKGFVPSNYLKDSIPVETPIKKDNEITDNKQIPTNVSNVTKVPAEKPIEPTPPTEASALGFFDRIKSTFSWNSANPS
ncbi:unnamed protein product [Adineta steineri]|uniref:RIMS-binding protein 2 n=1 Tax=Adineta steineri TaxID=433720 RepID=A0A819E158_9BILA|nr:unnamed protein product [Adineta steineri]